MGKTQRLIGMVLIIAALVMAAYAWRLSKEMVPGKPVMHSVVVAAERIPAGTLLTADKLKLMDFPERPVGSYGDVTGLIGQTAPVDLAPGEALLAERIAPTVALVPVQRLGEGERAVAIRVDEVIAVGNRLMPGDRVDVFATFRRNSEEIADSHARLLLSGLRILAFGSHDGGESGKAAEVGKKASGRGVTESPRTAVLAVPLTDVDKLALAAEAGRLLLALRPKEAEEKPLTNETVGAIPTLAKLPVADVQAYSLRELTAMRTPARAAPGAPAAGRPAEGVSVKVMHGMKETSVHFNSKKAGTGQ